ncbi:McrB family protein [Haloferax sp. CBA1150]|uniref:AAA domain-containing protein n=1 Tax=Haloferax marinum TaxID=2666143 RepID=A0A6A8G802_9EURY|nr:AAA family ATPase [Haloferax sp. CBA1150]KAB1198313.1 AAA domain-containing protein [Haloferax sp. CBA1150]MRW97410.1 AAA domain-containing protein [Haloferax marinum]
MAVYTQERARIFDSTETDEFWLHAVSQACQQALDGAQLDDLEPKDVETLLNIILETTVGGKRLAYKHPTIAYNRWEAMQEIFEREPEGSTAMFSVLLDESKPVDRRLRKFEEFFEPRLTKLGEKRGLPRSWSSSKFHGLSTFVLELLSEKSYVAYQYQATKQFFDEYTDYQVKNASKRDTATQYSHLVGGYEEILDELSSFDPDADVHDVHAIIYNRETLESLADERGFRGAERQADSIQFTKADIESLLGGADSEEGSKAVARTFERFSGLIGREFFEYDWFETLIWSEPSPGSPYLGPAHTSIETSPYIWFGMAHETMSEFGRPTKGLQVEFGLNPGEKSGFFGRDVLCGIYLNPTTGDTELKEVVASRLRVHSTTFAEFLEDNDDYVLHIGDHKLRSPSATAIERHADSVSKGMLLTVDLTATDLTTANDVVPLVAEAFQELLPLYGKLADVDDFGEIDAGGEGGSGAGTDGAEPPNPPVTKPDDAEEFVRHLEATGQMVFHGPPGTGKTAQAYDFAHWWVSEHDRVDSVTNNVDVLTVHPAYTYEDFVEGLTARTDDDGDVCYEVKDGPFKSIVQRAYDEYQSAAPGEAAPYVLILDEINRGNVAELFGEAISLLESDKRAGGAHELRIGLPHSGDEFTIPPNLYLIGTMNTADRSIALVDAALRRRFRFRHFPPDYEYLRSAHDFDSWDDVEAAAAGDASVDPLVARSILALRRLNERIRSNLDRGQQLGHSYLLNSASESGEFEEPMEVVDVWRFEILPMLEEHYFGQFDRLRRELFDGATVDLIDWETEQVASFDQAGLATALDELR